MIKGHDESRELKEKKNDDKSWKKKIGEEKQEKEADLGKKRASTLAKGEKGKWHDNDEKKIKIKMSSTPIN